MAETSAERLTRLLTLVPWLAAHSGVSKQDAARHFNLTVPQLEADLELITFTGPGMYGGELVDIAFEDETISVYDHQGLNRPLELSADESAALLVGLHALQQLPDVDAALVAQVIDKLSAYAGTGSDLDVLVNASPHTATIATAIAQTRDVRITYIHPLRDDATVRTVTPVSVISRHGVDYLNGWCHTAEAMRTFRLDRMHTCTVEEPSAPVAVDTDQATGTPAHAIVQVPAAAEYLLERVSSTIVERGASLRAQVEYADPRWLIAWVIGAGGALHVKEPVAVAHAVTERVRSALAAYTALDRPESVAR